MPSEPTKKKVAPPPRYPDEMRERAVRMVRDLKAADPSASHWKSWRLGVLNRLTQRSLRTSLMVSYSQALLVAFRSGFAGSVAGLRRSVV